MVWSWWAWSGQGNGLAMGKIDVCLGSGSALILSPGNVLAQKGVFVGFMGMLELACVARQHWSLYLKVLGIASSEGWHRAEWGSAVLGGSTAYWGRVA